MQNDTIEDDYDDPRIEGKGRSGFRWLLLLPALVILLFVWPIFASFYTDWLWFREVGFEKIFSTLLLTKLTLGVIAGLVAAALFWLNFKLTLRLSAAYSSIVRYFTINDQRVPAPDFARAAERWVLPVSLVIGLLSGLRVWDLWEVILKYRHRTSFGEADP